MMKFRLILFAFVLFLLGCKSEQNKTQLDLSESFGFNQDKPFGGSVAYKMLQNTYPNKYIDLQTKNFSAATRFLSDYNSIYFIYSKNFYTDRDDRRAIDQFLANGNTVFISAENFDSTFLKRFDLKIENLFAESFIVPPFIKTNTKLVTGTAFDEKEYSYFYRPFVNVFSKNDPYDYLRTVGLNGIDLPNVIVRRAGRGKLILHSEPKALSNYFLLTENNAEYFARIIGMFQEFPERIYWDNYYNRLSRPRDSDSSTLSEINKNPPLKYAFYTLVGCLLFYIIFNSKRRQRIVPIINKNKNSSVAFAEAIAGLYLKQHDNKNIAEKMIQYFQEYVRSNYFLSQYNFNEEFMNAVAKKTGHSQEFANELFQKINQIQANKNVSDNELLELNNLIQKMTKSK